MSGQSQQKRANSVFYCKKQLEANRFRQQKAAALSDSDNSSRQTQMKKGQADSQPFDTDRLASGRAFDLRE